METIQYRKLTKEERKGSRYKYELTKGVFVWVDLGPGKMKIPGYVYYYGGLLKISKGYRWDGSTVVFDTKNCMRASLVHDALYQLMREGLLSRSYRKYTDRLYQRMCIEDGMWRWHAGLRYIGLRLFGGWFCKLKSDI